MIHTSTTAMSTRNVSKQSQMSWPRIFARPTFTRSVSFFAVDCPSLRRSAVDSSQFHRCVGTMLR